MTARDRLRDLFLNASWGSQPEFEQALDDHRTEIRREQLSDPERRFLAFALRLAADQMASRGDEFDEDDRAALDSLRALATGPAPEPLPYTEASAAFMAIGHAHALPGLRTELRIEGSPILVGRYAGAGMRTVPGQAGQLIIEPALVFEWAEKTEDES